MDAPDRCEHMAEIEGTGGCAEAQADGVPCTGTRRICQECERAEMSRLAGVATE